MITKYFVIEKSEDDPFFTEVSEKQLIERLDKGEFDGYTFLSKPPKDCGFMYWPSMSVLIIGIGGYVLPKQKEVVKKWSIE